MSIPMNRVATMMNTQVSLRAADKTDLPAVNGVIERAIMGWKLPERVKRLSLPLYRYNEMDLEHLELCVAEAAGQIIALAAWEPAEASDIPRLAVACCCMVCM